MGNKKLYQRTWLAVILAIIIYLIFEIASGAIITGLRLYNFPFDLLIKLIFYGILCFVIFPFVFHFPSGRVPIGKYLEEIRLTFNPGILRLLGIFIACYLVFACSQLLGSWIYHTQIPETLSLNFSRASFLNTGNIISGLFEEIVWRGIILSLFLVKYNERKAILLSSILFGTIHLLNLLNPGTNASWVIAQGIWSFALGYMYGVLVIRFRSLIPAILLHYTINAMVGVWFEGPDQKNLTGALYGLLFFGILPAAVVLLGSQLFKKVSVAIVLSLLFLTSCLYVERNDRISSKGFQGLSVPDSIPEVFAPGIVSVKDRYEYGLSISPDEKELFFTAGQPGEGLMLMRRKPDGIWTAPVAAHIRGDNFWEFEAFYSYGGKKLLFSSTLNDTSRLWIAEKVNGEWCNPVILNSPVNNTPVFWGTCSKDNTLYYTNLEKRRIYRSQFGFNGYDQTKEVALPFGVHPFIAMDESFILFDHAGDLYIAYMEDKGKWTDPQRLPEVISSKEYYESCPSLTPDEKVLFFSRYNDENEKSDIYWVRFEPHKPYHK